MDSQTSTETIESRTLSFNKVKETVNPDQTSTQNQFGILKETHIEQNTDNYQSYPTDTVIVFDTDLGDYTGELVIPSDSDSEQYKDLLRWAECDSIRTLCEREVPVNKYSEQVFTVPPYVDSELPTHQIKKFSKQNVGKMYDCETDTWDFELVTRIHNNCSTVLLISLTVIFSSMLVAFTSMNLPFVIVSSAILSILSVVFTFVTGFFNTINSVYCDRVVLRK